MDAIAIDDEKTKYTLSDVLDMTDINNNPVKVRVDIPGVFSIDSLKQQRDRLTKVIGMIDEKIAAISKAQGA